MGLIAVPKSRAAVLGVLRHSRQSGSGNLMMDSAETAVISAANQNTAFGILILVLFYVPAGLLGRKYHRKKV